MSQFYYTVQKFGGVYDTKLIDRVHLKFCKKILGVKSQTSNMAVLGELGRYPLSLLCKERVLKYWLKIMKNRDSLKYNFFNIQCNNNYPNRHMNWAPKVKTILDDLGFGNLWNNIDINYNYFPMIRNRLRDQFKQNWHAEVTNSPKLQYYVKYKTEFKYEPYLDIVDNDYLRKLFTCFRLSSHSLYIETGRYTGIVRENRICRNCNLNLIESEYHFLMTCCKYRSIRMNFLTNISWPSIHKFCYLMQSNNKKTLTSICKYLKEAYLIRNENNN